MVPQIRYCKSADGVRLAYAVFGEGPPCVYVGHWSWNTALEWEHPAVAAYFEKLARGRMPLWVRRCYNSQLPSGSKFPSISCENPIVF